jgi:CBS domain-containing protein
MAVKDYCLRKPVTVDPATSLLAAAQIMKRESVGCVVVTEHGRPIGLVTDRDIALEVLGHKRVSADVPVRDVMHQPVETIDAEAPLERAVLRLRTRRLRRLPVVDAAGSVVGILTIDDVLRLLATELGELAEVVRRQLEYAPSSLTPTMGDAR